MIRSEEIQNVYDYDPKSSIGMPPRASMKVIYVDHTELGLRRAMFFVLLGEKLSNCDPDKIVSTYDIFSPLCNYHRQRLYAKSKHELWR